VPDKVIVVTSASSGIGKTSSSRRQRRGDNHRCAKTNWSTQKEIEAAGGGAWIPACDVSETLPATLVARVLATTAVATPHPQRRPVDPPRHHQFVRPLHVSAHHALNYFGAAPDHWVPPKMIEKKRITSSTSRRSACYPECAPVLGIRRVEIRARLVLGVRVVGVPRRGHWLHLHRLTAGAHADDRPPDVQNLPTLSPEEAADLVVEAIVYKPVRIATRLGIFGAVSHAAAPRLTQILLNTAFHMFPDSSAAAGKKDGAAQPLSAEQMAFAQLTQGMH
jgi:hypothetical protein